MLEYFLRGIALGGLHLFFQLLLINLRFEAFVDLALVEEHGIDTGNRFPMLIAKLDRPLDVSKLLAQPLVKRNTSHDKTPSYFPTCNIPRICDQSYALVCLLRQG